MQQNQLVKPLLLFISMMFMTSCGGDGGGSEANSAPPLPAEPRLTLNYTAVSQLQFSWEKVKNVSYYRMMLEASKTKYFLH